MIELLIGVAGLLWAGGCVGYMIGFYDAARKAARR